MRLLHSATAVMFALAFWSGFGQAQSLSITNYQVVTQYPFGPDLIGTYRATVVNTGAALPELTATVMSLDESAVQVISGQGTLMFGAVPANGSAVSTNTIALVTNAQVPFDPSKLQWSFQTANGPVTNGPVANGPVANAGPNQTVTVGQTVVLNGSGSTNPSGIGSLTYSWTLLSRPAGSSAYILNSSSVISSFTVDVPGAYTVQLTVSNGTASSSATTTVSTGATPPVANAGFNQTVRVGATVILNGSGSTSSSGRPLSYAWTIVAVPAGSTARLSGSQTVSPTFIADKPGVYNIQLIVNDGLASSPSTVTITTLLSAPVANAGPSQVVEAGATVQLNGSGSTDPNGLPLSYLWQLVSTPAGSTAMLKNSAAVNPTFTADRPGTFVAQLIVNDGHFTSAPSTVTITTDALLAPVANAGQNRTVTVGSLVTLAGAGTDPQNRSLTYQWSLISKPSGSTATLSSAVIPNPTFVADQNGAYIAQLIVNDGLVSSAPSTVTISTTCSQPTANPGMNQNVSAGQTVTLNGSGSGDACSDPLKYTWSLTTRPTGSMAVLSNAAIADPTFVADLAGVYVAQLMVNNGFANSNPATVMITASAALQASLSFSPGTMVVNGTSTQTLTLVLSPAAPSSGAVVNLISSNPGTATVPATVSIAPNSTSTLVPVTGVAIGSATITASLRNYPNATASISVMGTQGPSVTWYGACWQDGSPYDVQGELQSIEFSLVTSTPAELEGTLFYTSNCDPSQGQDNLNDLGKTIGGGSWEFSFIHHPSQIPSSAYYWFGPLTLDGKCPAGAPCSGCVNYTAATPKCQ